jgi:hypothetical protein
MHCNLSTTGKKCTKTQQTTTHPTQTNPVAKDQTRSTTQRNQNYGADIEVPSLHTYPAHRLLHRIRTHTHTQNAAIRNISEMRRTSTPEFRAPGSLERATDARCQQKKMGGTGGTRPADRQESSIHLGMVPSGSMPCSRQ